jgi:hypothetical protein
MVSFNPASHALVFECVVSHGPYTRRIKLLLDTGCTDTTLKLRDLVELNAIPVQLPPVEIVTGSSVVKGQYFVVDELEILGFKKSPVRVMGLPFPEDLQVDGMIGWDFLADKIVKIDFPAGKLDITAKRTKTTKKKRK